MKDSNETLSNIFAEIDGKAGGIYKLSSKLPWHCIIRPDVTIYVSYFNDLIDVKIESDSNKDIGFLFEKHTGRLIESSRQIMSLWPINTVEELEANIKYADQTLVRYGIAKKKK